MFRRYPSGAIAVHDLDHLGGLSDDPGLTLFVSPRTLYLLQNLAGADVTLSSRYALDLLYGGYIPVADTDPEYLLYESVVRELQVEVIPLPGWTDFNPELRQPPGEELTLSSFSASYLRDPRGICDWHATLACNEAAAVGDIQLTMPGVPLPDGEFLVGRFLLLDVGSRFYEGAIVHVGSQNFKMIVDGGTSYLGASSEVVLAAGDAVWAHCRYRCEVT